MPKSPRQLDSRIEIVTPENIAFQYVLAGPFRRLPAYLIDCAILTVVMFSTFLLVALWSALIGELGVGFGLWLILVFILTWFYFGLFETFWNGQTPGKRIMGLRVLTIDGQPVNAMQAIVRNVLRFLDGMPMLPMFGSTEIGIPLYMLGLACATVSNRYQRLGDVACGTIVVVERRSALRGLARVNQMEVLKFAQDLPVNLGVNRTMSQALSKYVARRELFSAARRFEIARVLAEPLCERWQLPPNTNPDLLLCAVYYRTFVEDRPTETVASVPRAAQVVSP